MPIIEFHLMVGRTPDQKRQLLSAVTDTVVDVLGVRPDQVRILIHNVTPEHFSMAGITAAERMARTVGSGAPVAASLTAAEKGDQQ
ncbi:MULTISPECIES: tautomerase family protein [Pseudomonas]|uniref:2-hydroxymuconate tautomerase n=1 Tax=Pseudomonas hunanensis TaxID=1247546 RepID=A0ABD6MVZ5_9PSED|nr:MULTISPECIES: tautomerase family protein [Pseudomonas]MDH4846239.1 4-oxalocrotonate tautomerase [Pseudomonas sp. BN605]MDH4858528.1 4-oxalocrotonate tautomerase [Pseudomonas sp. BN505]NWL07992.1 4-oxalocrotonate tautomerase [Pseudomonas hunanensis]NWL45128.1 4-oxalocrotonate tautomerase [Pseudomonas hunanensis]